MANSVIFKDHVQGTDAALWKCGECGHEWVSATFLLCDRCNLLENSEKEIEKYRFALAKILVAMWETSMDFERSMPIDLRSAIKEAGDLFESVGEGYRVIESYNKDHLIETKSGLFAGFKGEYVKLNKKTGVYERVHCEIT